MSKKNIKLLSFTVIIGVVATVSLLSFGSKNYDDKKYDKNMFSNSPDVTMTKGKQRMAQKRRHNTKIEILSDNTASMGDFIFNSGGNTKIVANISLKFQNSKDGWFNSNDAKKEIVKRGVILRSAIIDTMMDNHGLKTNDDKIKTKLLDNINYYLSDAIATEIYFNKFIVQY